MKNQNIRVSTRWEHSLTNLLGHYPTSEPGIALRQWVHHHGVENYLDLLSWEEEEVKANRTQQVFSLDDHGQPPQIYKLLSEDAMKALKSYNTESITRFHQRKVHNTKIVETPKDDPPVPPVPENDPPDVPESDLDILDDPILDFVNTQCHNSEALDQALQAYQAYQVPSP